MEEALEATVALEEACSVMATNMEVTMEVTMEVITAVTDTNLVILTEAMEAMARDLLTLARTTLSRTEELRRRIPRLIPRLTLKQDLDLEAMEDSTEEVCMEASVVLV